MRKILHLPVTSVPAYGILTAARMQDKWSVEGLNAILQSIEVQEKKENAWFTIYIGKYRNISLFAAQHPIGCPGTEIMLEELYSAGARCIIRLGSCFGILAKSSDIVVPTKVRIGEVGIASYYGFPFRSELEFNHEIVKKIELQLRKNKLKFKKGVIYSSDSFISPVKRANELAKQGILAAEMECCAFALWNKMHKDARSACILVVDGDLKRVKACIANKWVREYAMKRYRDCVKACLQTFLFLEK